MTLLLDTHVLVWWVQSPHLLSQPAMNACSDRSNRVLLSVAVLWELQIKIQIGKLKLPQSLAAEIERQQTDNRFEVLDMKTQHVLALEQLPLHHRDPFDRMLIAQANVEGATLVTKDALLSAYSVPQLW